ncbi:hypothetical protein C8J57DRAFT_1719118 [Mycena rebaudengoi]|nr:hypothetical protein C8J57DRAFT_1719118 [Mycena rebaudengoi]
MEWNCVCANRELCHGRPGRNESGSGGGVECRVVSDEEDEEACTCTTARGIPTSELIVPTPPPIPAPTPTPTIRGAAIAPGLPLPSGMHGGACHPRSVPPPPQLCAAPVPSPSLSPPSIPSASAPAPSSTSIAFPSASYTHGVYRKDAAPPFALKDALPPLLAVGSVYGGLVLPLTLDGGAYPAPGSRNRRLRKLRAALVPPRPSPRPSIPIPKPITGEACFDIPLMGDGCCECESAGEWESTDDCDRDRAWRPNPIPTPNPRPIAPSMTVHHTYRAAEEADRAGDS